VLERDKGKMSELSRVLPFDALVFSSLPVESLFCDRDVSVGLLRSGVRRRKKKGRKRKETEEKRMITLFMITLTPSSLFFLPSLSSPLSLHTSHVPPLLLPSIVQQDRKKRETEREIERERERESKREKREREKGWRIRRQTLRVKSVGCVCICRTSTANAPSNKDEKSPKKR
jgi:hypothetical protein